MTLPNLLNPFDGKLQKVAHSVLTDDDHTQYALLAGRSGGQILYSGTDAGDGGESHTTSHATKGVWNHCDTLYTDEVNNRVGIGIAAPERALHVVGDAVANILLEGPSASGALIDLKTGNVAATVNGLRFIDSADATDSFIGFDLTENNFVISKSQITIASNPWIAIDQASGNVGMGGIIAPLGKCHIDQTSTTAAIPALVLDQADISEGTINFVASARGTSLTTAGDIQDTVRVELNGTIYRLALYTDA